MKVLLTALASLASFIVAAAASIVLVVVFAGPHSDLLPSWLQVVVYIAAWAGLIAVPIVVGRITWRRLHRRRL